MPADRVTKRNLPIESAAIAGIVFAVLAVVSMALFRTTPAASLSDAELQAWYEVASNRRGLMIGLSLGSIAAIAFLWFVAVVRRRIGEREDRFFATVFFGSSVAYVAVWMVGGAAVTALAVTWDTAGQFEVTQSAVAYGNGLAAALLLIAGPRLQAVFILSTSTLFLRTKALPNWIAYVGYVIGLILLVVPLVFQAMGVGLPLWVFVSSITILITRQRSGGDDLLA